MELSLQEVCWGGILGFIPVGKGKEKRGQGGKEKEGKGGKRSSVERRNQDWQTEKLDCHATTVWPRPIPSCSQVAHRLRPALVYCS